MPAVYIDLDLKLREEGKPELDLEKRVVYISNKTHLDTVLVLLKELMLGQKHKHLFCLKWDDKNFYFDKKGRFSQSGHAVSGGNIWG